MTLESVISLFEEGASAEEVGLRYDVLDLHDIYATLSYIKIYPVCAGLNGRLGSRAEQ